MLKSSALIGHAGSMKSGRNASRALHPEQSSRSKRLIPVQANSPIWTGQFNYLREQVKLESIPPAKAVESGWVLVDIRMKEDYAKAHAANAKNAPFFQKTELGQASPQDMMRAMAQMANGIQPTMRNPLFEQTMRDIASQLRGDQGVIIYCDAGGTLETNVNFPVGKSSRSLLAIEALCSKGILPANKVKHLQGGLLRYVTEQQPMVGVYDVKSAAGRTPASVNTNQ